jgi:hypothetical protein
MTKSCESSPDGDEFFLVEHHEIFEGEDLKETVLEELNKQTEETIQTMVETEAQKEFMRYAFLKEPKTPIGKM